jgi:hypothetical protein
MKPKPIGVVKELAEPHKTLCDFDGQLPADLYERCLRLSRMIGVRMTSWRCDRTKRGHHLVITWARDFEPAQIVAMQAILGSDPNREALNLLRLLSKPEGEMAQRCTNILYSKKL